jgi:NAD(P) transhydrogenase
MHFDLIVIGSGPAGCRAALQGAKAGKKVVIIEECDAMGGACVHAGTLPSKSFRESVYRWSLSSHGTLGLENPDQRSAKSSKKMVLPDMRRLLKRRDRVVSNEYQIVFDQIKRNGITIVQGRGRVTSPNTVEVINKKGVKKNFQASFIFIAVGAGPISPAETPVDGKFIHDSDTILTMKKVPKSIIVLGAGVIGAEFASMFSMAGSQVYLVDKRPGILASVDHEIVDHLIERFVSLGMEMVLNAETEKIVKSKSKKNISVHLKGGRKLVADCVLIAQGRAGHTGGLGLKELGVVLDGRGLVKVDENFRTAVPSIYAVGDVVGPPALASTSMEQGRVACVHAFGLTEWGETVMPKLFPYGIYTIPEISTVGASEDDLKAKKIDFVVGRARYKELARGQIVGDQWGLLKILVDRKTLKLHGIHIMGDSAADLIHIGQAVMDFGGDVNYFIRTVFNYPTLAEAYKTAAFHAVNQIKGTTKTK